MIRAPLFLNSISNSDDNDNDNDNDDNDGDGDDDDDDDDDNDETLIVLSPLPDAMSLESSVMLTLCMSPV